jgi:hypothetical protein
MGIIFAGATLAWIARKLYAKRDKFTSTRVGRTTPLVEIVGWLISVIKMGLYYPTEKWLFGKIHTSLYTEVKQSMLQHYKSRLLKIRIARVNITIQ